MCIRDSHAGVNDLLFPRAMSQAAARAEIKIIQHKGIHKRIIFPHSLSYKIKQRENVSRETFSPAFHTIFYTILSLSWNSINQISCRKQRDIKLAALQSSGVFDPQGNTLAAVAKYLQTATWLVARRNNLNCRGLSIFLKNINQLIPNWEYCCLRPICYIYFLKNTGNMIFYCTLTNV